MPLLVLTLQLYRKGIVDDRLVNKIANSLIHCEPAHINCCNFINRTGA